ncbi:MAG: cell wall hydrolase, partial [Paracoccus sp. (in: a-proteobacteria)]
MPKLLHRLARACLCAATALPIYTTSAAAGGSGSLFSADTGLFAAAAMPAAAAIQLESARHSPLLYANNESVKIEIDADIDIEQLHLASVRNVSQADVECMAEALYHEARGEGTQGQQAVAEVILNRVDSRVFPASVCGVINQPSQFSYTIGGTKPIRNKSAYLRARAIAESALSGAPRNLTGGATYFHTPAVRPSWSNRFQ